MFVIAHVTSWQVFSTARGQRLYVVFKAVDSRELALWVTPRYLQENDLGVGDVVLLRRNHQGCSWVAFCPLPCQLQLKLFAWFNQGRRWLGITQAKRHHLDHS